MEALIRKSGTFGSQQHHIDQLYAMVEFCENEVKSLNRHLKKLLYAFVFLRDTLLLIRFNMIT